MLGQQGNEDFASPGGGYDELAGQDLLDALAANQQQHWIEFRISRVGGECRVGEAGWPKFTGLHDELPGDTSDGYAVRRGRLRESHGEAPENRQAAEAVEVPLKTAEQRPVSSCSRRAGIPLAGGSAHQAFPVDAAGLGGGFAAVLASPDPALLLAEGDTEVSFRAASLYLSLR